MNTAPEPFSGHGGAVRAIAVFPDGRRIVTGGDDRMIRIWDLRTGTLLAHHTEHEDEVLAVAATGDGRVVSCGRTAMVVWDSAKRVRVSRTPHGARVTEVAISPGGDVVAAIDLDGSIHRPGGGVGWPSRHRRVDSIAVTANGQVITAGAGPLVHVVDRSGTELDRLDGRATVTVAGTVAGSTDGRRVAFATPEAVWCWDRKRSPSRPVRLTGSHDAVTMVVTPDGKQVVAGGFGGDIRAWDPDQRPAEPISMPGRGSPVRSLAVTPDCRQLVSGAEDGTIRVWDLGTGGEVFPGRKARPQPAIASDRESALDLLGFTGDVDSMAALITDRETRPPLAIALLGRWGSGKSSFMRQLQERVALLTEQGRRNPARSVFATAVRQVRFDAWHYNDDQLWVGMVEHLFAALAEPGPPDTEAVRAERDALREDLRDLEDLADPNTPGTRRLRARLRLWLARLARWRGRVLLSGVAVALLGTATGLTWGLWGDAVVTWVAGTLTAVAASPIVDRVIAAWRSVRGVTGRRADDLEQAVRTTRMRLARFDAAQRLALAVEEARSGGYDQYRGLLGRVHTDLRRLSDSAGEAFAEWDRAGASGVPPLERVILYIDDLDRCSPRKVVDVLAAVHLLLALPFFVVVVAVDPRWLRRCLEQYHSELFGGPVDGLGGATPLDYLDKIFQVVFALRPMGSGAVRLVEALVPTEPGLWRGAGQQAGPSTSGRDGSTGHVLAGDAPPEVAGSQPSSPVAQPERLRLRVDELRFIQRMCTLLETPRAVKRFVNLYRLVRAPVVDDDDFIGADGAGPYQAVLVLLAVLVSAPDAGRDLVATLETADRAGSFTALVNELASAERKPRERDLWPRLLVVLCEGAPTHDSVATYCDWAGTIARFSFETWDLTRPR
jgi:WD40 repeat protein